MRYVPEHRPGRESSTEREHNEQQQSQPSAADSPRVSDYDKVGARSIDGLEASELPDKGRGDVFTDVGKEGKRNLPQNTGETVGPGASHQTGLRGDPDLADAARNGGRKHN